MNLGKRRTAALAVLAQRGRSTGLDIAKVATRNGVSMTMDGALGVVVDLQGVGLAEPSEPHLDERGMLRGTWTVTTAGRAALAAEQAYQEAPAHG